MNSQESRLFKKIFENTPVSTQIFTPDGETLYVNSAWESLWQISFKKLKRYNILQDKQLVKTGVMPYVKRGFSGETVTLPMIRYVPSESVSVKGAIPYRILAAKLYPVSDNKGEILYLVLQHEDVTDNKEASDAKYHLAAIVESSRDVIISKDLNGYIRSWNRAAEKLFGYTEEEAIGRHITLLIPEELRNEEDDIIANIRKSKRVDHFETTRVTKSGELVSVSLSISPIKNEKGEIIGASKIARDIREKKKTEEILKESEERLRIALDAGNIGVWDWDIEKNKLTWTEKVYKIHGVSPKNFTVSFESFSALIFPEDRERVEKAITLSLEGREPFSLDFRIITPKDETRWLHTSAHVFYDGKKNPQRMLGATIDISRQKQLEQDKSDFLSMASHELKTPLTSIKIFIELLSKELEKSGTEKQRYYLSRINGQANRFSELTNDLLDVSRIEIGKLRLNKKTFDLNELIKDTIESLELTAKDQKIIFSKRSVGLVNGDKYRIYQVIVNLLTNAIKYSPRDGEITVKVRQGKNDIEVSIRDQGIGIKPNKQVKIFEKLYQVSDPKEKTYPGLGLGLYISKEIIDRHNGKIWVKSEGLGKGSTFYFSIPK